MIMVLYFCTCIKVHILRPFGVHIHEALPRILVNCLWFLLGLWVLEFSKVVKSSWCVGTQQLWKLSNSEKWLMKSWCCLVIEVCLESRYVKPTHWPFIIPYLKFSIELIIKGWINFPWNHPNLCINVSGFANHNRIPSFFAKLIANHRLEKQKNVACTDDIFSDM